jgi:hypothetical protein
MNILKLVTPSSMTVYISSICLSSSSVVIK